MPQPLLIYHAINSETPGMISSLKTVRKRMVRQVIYIAIELLIEKFLFKVIEVDQNISNKVLDRWLTGQQGFTFYTIKYLKGKMWNQQRRGRGTRVRNSSEFLATIRGILAPLSTGSLRNDNRFRESVKRGVKCIQARHSLYDILPTSYKCKRRGNSVISLFIKKLSSQHVPSHCQIT